VTVFVGAFLLFQVKPLIGKHCHPRIGGGLRGCGLPAGPINDDPAIAQVWTDDFSSLFGLL
jgi:hypothetical protein